MMRNVINSAFESVTTVSAGIELLETFVHLSPRENIRRTIDKKTAELYTLFSAVGRSVLILLMLLGFEGSEERV